MKILIADDSMCARTLLSRMLADLGVTDVLHASDGTEAISLFEKEQPVVVFMDIVMKNVGGIQAIKEIKKIDPTAKVIACSALGQQDVILEAIQCGACDFLVKPFLKEDVYLTLKKALT